MKRIILSVTPLTLAEFLNTAENTFSLTPREASWRANSHSSYV